MIARSPDESRGPDLLTLLRAAGGPMSLDQLRATGIPRPADAIYQLQLSGHRITRTSHGHELDEGPRQPPAPQEPPPRVRITPRSAPS